MSKDKKKFRISGTLIFNIIVAILSIYLLVYFFVSDGGIIDLLKTPDSFNVWWLLVALLAYDFNMFMDSIVTLIYIRTQFKSFKFSEAVKVALVGVFFGAVTPSNTGGQPMQLFLLSKKKVGIGFGSACLTQKFIVYQIISTAFSMLAVVVRFKYLQDAFINIWSTLFIIVGFVVQLAVTALFLIVSFSSKITHKIIQIVYWIMVHIKFVKNPEHKKESIEKEFAMFHKSNKELMHNKKRLVAIYICVAIQVLAILSVPYFIYLSFGMPKIAVANGQQPASLFDFICIQSFVLFTSNLVPLPGASGGAELAFSIYFTPFFVIGGVQKIKPAILLWRLTTYYGSIIISAPFSYYTKGRKEFEENELEQISEQEYEQMEASVDNK
ncbi:MAG: lysylphosphatidylglycerol synthase transmembrane domain-containing protein [Ruminococcus bromii]|nr:lysylphosphatidylglycerol synthase transmembrane domain-containing protein [Ruminococcus bromii]